MISLQNSLLQSFRFQVTILKSCLFIITLLLVIGCDINKHERVYDYTIEIDEEEASGIMRITGEGAGAEVTLISFYNNPITVEDLVLNITHLSGSYELFGDHYTIDGEFVGDIFEGIISTEDEELPITATKQSEDIVKIDRSGIEYILAETNISDSEKNIDHRGLINSWDNKSFRNGSRIYNANCINCHGNPEIEGSIPLSLKFWEQPFKGGSDAFSMYQTITRGFGSMPPQLTLTPREKYDVIYFIQESFIKPKNNEEFVSSTPGYLSGLPKGKSLGPEIKPYHPWSDMDYGNFFINTYELVDEETGPERFHSPGPSPFPDEDYSKNNFAYKGIAVRLDEGEGGVSRGKAWMMFDHDLMRVAGAWTGDGFIDWNAILLNDRHETYPRTVGKLHFETPVGPGWVNPSNGKFDDPRYTARDGRQFGPLPKSWANYKGLYHNGNDIIISYSIGDADVLERFGMEEIDGNIAFTRTLNVSPSASILKIKVAPSKTQVAIKGNGASLSKEDGFYMLSFKESTTAQIKIIMANDNFLNFEDLLSSVSGPEELSKYTTGGEMHYPEIVKSEITKGIESGPFVVDVLAPPFKNPWNARMKLSGIDFLEDANVAVACATDGDVWKITGLTEGGDSLRWQRIGSGLFQPLGIKVINEEIFVTCRDQLVRLKDLNGDGETDFYESFNHDHQVTDHFHEFAMGLQADKNGNLYYAKSGRHAREALIPQHGTLMKVSNDGSSSEIVATGFRAANGVCINPDGSFIVTDQQGYWNPMNRINWVEVDGRSKFYGNMWGYNPPKDSSRAAMEQPLVWVDMDFDRSPSELLWVDSEKWGPLDGSLLSFSYGYGKIQLVLNEEVNGQRQGGVIDLPGIKFLTGVMRGRFNPSDGQLYACGMSAWGTSQLMWGGGLYRVRYTDKTLPIPTLLEAKKSGVEITFAEDIDPAEAENIENYEIETWNLIRSKRYGSDRHDRKFLDLSSAKLKANGRTIKLSLNDIEPVDAMTIKYTLKDVDGNQIEGKLQNTIHNLGREGAI